MTFRELAKQISTWDAEKQDSDVTVHIVPDDEYFKTGDSVEFCNDGVLDDNHPFIWFHR